CTTWDPLKCAPDTPLERRRADIERQLVDIRRPALDVPQHGVERVTERVTVFAHRRARELGPEPRDQRVGRIAKAHRAYAACRASHEHDADRAWRGRVRQLEAGTAAAVLSWCHAQCAGGLFVHAAGRAEARIEGGVE